MAGSLYAVRDTSASLRIAALYLTEV